MHWEVKREAKTLILPTEDIMLGEVNHLTFIMNK